ncbi:MAG: ATP-dependent helicase [Verrucomicrobiae bacterium]|nr:ATP-dependent helicase [Verrucomicrobiae bacterium]
MRYTLQTHHTTQKIDYAQELNTDQFAAVTAAPGPALVIAGAGSGKTRTLIYRVAYLFENGIAPQQILLLTFTNKAAREMLYRVENLLPIDASQIWGGTFHAIGNRLLRRHASEVGLRPDFTILDREDSKSLLTSCLASLGLSVKDKKDKKDKLFPRADAILELFSLAINTQQSLEQLASSNFVHLTEYLPQLTQLQTVFQQRKKSSNVVDYDDLLTLPLALLENHETIRQRYQQQWLYLLVDEYQDTNLVQARLIDLLAAQHKNLMVVGDDAQSIYSWRGANFANILDFPKKYPEATTYRIETNYRSTPEILAVANASISHNVKQHPKHLHSNKPASAKPALVPLTDATQQARFIAQRIQELHDEGIALNEIAILYRAHSHAIELQLELSRRNIPFLITSGIQFFEQAHIKDLCAILKIAINPNDEVAFKRTAQLLPGIGDRGAEKLWSQLQGKTVWDGISPTSAKSLTSWQKLSQLIDQLRAMSADPAANPDNATFIQLILEKFYENYLKLTFDNAEQRLDDLRQLQEFSQQFETLSDFLSQITLLTNVDTPQGRLEENKENQLQDTLKLSTIHQAKGLEWKIVFLIMLCDGALPMARCLHDPDQLEEERRLFYVAVTRARDALYLTYPLMRLQRNPITGDLFQTRSRFLNEIPEKLLEEWKVETPATSFSQTNPGNLRGSANWL